MSNISKRKKETTLPAGSKREAEVLYSSITPDHTAHFFLIKVKYAREDKK